MENIGELCEVQEKKFEWQIKNFLDLSSEARACYESPKFSFCGISWSIQIYPNGDINEGSVGWIDLYISPKSLTAPITLDWSLDFKTVDGKADKFTGYHDTDTFDELNYAWGAVKFISRIQLIKRKSELLPSGILTVICTLREKDTERWPLRNLTGDEAIEKCTQTEDGTGIWKLQEQFKKIFENGNVSDVILKVEGQEFKSHRCVLAARSPVFLAMLSHETKEKNTGVVGIQDIDPETFADFLSYLYSGSDEIITPESVVKLFTAADKYQVDELKKSCFDYMLINISVHNFCDLLSLSLEHAEKDLTDACSRFFIGNSLPIVKTPKWLIFATKNPVAANELHIKHLENTNMKIKI